MLISYGLKCFVGSLGNLTKYSNLDILYLEGISNSTAKNE